MKQKVYHLLTLAGLICSIHHSAYAQQPSEKKVTSSVADTTRHLQKLIVSVRDLLSSRSMDSVRVMINGKSEYTINGVVSFEDVTKNSTISFSKPGYYPLSKKASAEMMIVSLVKSNEDASDASIVNKGVYKTPASMFSGAAITISGNDLRKINPNSFVEALKYYVPSLNVIESNNNGSNPNTLPQINLRGANSIPYPATVANDNKTTSGVQISPSSGDFIAANTTIAGTPVILLDGVQVSLQTAVDIDMTRIQDVTVLRDASATAVYGMRGGNGVIAIQTIRPTGLVNVSITSQVQIASADVSSYHLLNAQQKSALESQVGLNTSSSNNNPANTNWLAVPLNNGVGTKNSIALSSGNNDVNYGLNASYNDIEGSMKGSNRKIADLGAYFGGHFGSFSFNNTFSYLGTNAANSPYGAYSNYVNLNPYWSPYDPATGKMTKILESDVVNGVTTNYTNPAYNATIATTDAAKYSRFSDVTNLNWVIVRGLQLNGMASISRQADELDYFLPPDNTAFANVSVNNIFTRGSYNYTTNSFLDVEGRLSLQYQHNIGKHQFFATIGENVMQTSSEAAQVLVTGFTVDQLADIAFGTGYGNLKPTGNLISTRYASTFGTFAYSYDERFQVDLSGALDYYSGLSNNPNRFGAVGLSWNIKNETFLKNVDWINRLKVRGSAGITGNQYFLSYLNRTTYNYYTDQQYIPGGSNIGTIGTGLGAYLTSYANPNLQAPQTFKQNAGLDAAFFGNRLAVSFDVYKQKTTNLILPDISVPSTGYLNYSSYQNYGGVENNGFEFSAIGTVYRATQNNFSWSIALNGIHNTDKVTSIAPFLDNLNSVNNTTADQTVPQAQYKVGYSPSAIWAVPSLGIDPKTGMEMFQKKDGSVTETWDANDKVFAGNMTPSFAGSFGTDLTFRQFAAGAYFNYQLGAKVYNQTLADMENADLTYNVDSRAASPQRWVPGMTNALYKGLSADGLITNPTYVTTRFVENDNKIQSASLTLSYALPKIIAQKILLKSMTLRFIANNAFELGGANMQRGIYYPFQRNYTTSLNANF
ncbi:MAG TPA: SusC/RagA family TonB-linked outer membrane protein [Mucilaginibacter sp.]|jgi:TonB-linked SusC/RagA family outer membrane protein